MKKLFLLSLAVLPFINAAAQDDDLYFTPDMNGVVEDVQTNSPSNNRRTDDAVYANAKYSVYNNNARDEDEYNRRYNFSGGYQTEGGADYSLDYESNDTVFNTDTIYDNTDDYAYSRRILRFHSPRVAVALSSPYYWDLVYGYGVYDYLYDAYYDPFFYSWGWGYGWSWGPWSCWYGGLWGWYHPYHWSYWGWGPGWRHSYWGGHYRWNHGRYSDRGGRGGFRNRFDRGQSIRTNHLANGGNASLSRGTFGGRTNGIASRTSSIRTLRGGDGVGLRANNGSRAARTGVGRNVASRSSYSDYTRSRSISTPDSRVTNRSTGRTTAQNRTSYSRPSSSRSTFTPSRSSYESGRSVYTPSRSSSNNSYSRPNRSYSAPSRSSSSGSFGGGRSSFGGGRSAGFGGGGGSRGGFGGGGGRGGGRR